MCTGNQRDKYACYGDMGGPLFGKDGDTWVLIGVVSFSGKQDGGTNSVDG